MDIQKLLDILNELVIACFNFFFNFFKVDLLRQRLGINSQLLPHRGKLRNRRLRRRHTVGGTKDFADIEIIEPCPQSEREQPVDMIGSDTYADDSYIGNGGRCVGDSNSGQRTEGFDPVFPNTSLYHHSVMMNVDRSLGQWIRRQQKIGKSSPDLSLIGRRLSLPDSVLAASAAFYPFTSLLESQV